MNPLVLSISKRYKSFIGRFKGENRSGLVDHGIPPCTMTEPFSSSKTRRDISFIRGYKKPVGNIAD